MWQIKKTSDIALLSGTASAAAARPNGDESSAEYLTLKMELHQRLLGIINLQALESMTRPQIETEIGEIVHEQLALQRHALNQQERRKLVSEILDELLGLGPLEPLLQDPTINDILVKSGHDVVSVERAGKLERTEKKKPASATTVTSCASSRRSSARWGRRIDESLAIRRRETGGRLARQCRYPPLAVDGPLAFHPQVRKGADQHVAPG